MENEVLNNEETVETAEEVKETAAEEVKEVAAEESTEEKAAPAEGERSERQYKPQMQMRRRKKVCAFCVDKIDHIDYKDTTRLRKYVTERAKILPRRVSGTCAKHQRQLTVAIKRARHMALMSYLSD